MPTTTHSDRRPLAARRLARLRAHLVAGILSTLVATVSCADDSTLVTPLPSAQTRPPGSPSDSDTVSGIVIEHTATDHHPRSTPRTP